MTVSTRTLWTSHITAWARYAVIAVAWLFAVAGVVQVFLAGLSVFDSPSYWVDHVDFGRMIGVLALLLPILALVGRVGIRLGVMALLVTVLYVLQFILANLDNGAIAALHAVNALVLIGLSGSVGTQTLNLVRAKA